jgi:AcrR family transcriptional regulator
LPRVLTSADLADFRGKLIAAATRIFAEKGREGFTMREVAAELGVSAMTPYRYFKDKGEILAAVRANAFDRFAEALENAYAGHADAVSRGGAVGDAYVSFAFKEPASYRLMFDMSQPDEADYPDLVRATTRARRTMTDYVRSLVDAGLLVGAARRGGVATRRQARRGMQLRHDHERNVPRAERRLQPEGLGIFFPFRTRGR